MSSSEQEEDWRSFYHQLSENPVNTRLLITGSTAELNSLMDGLESDFDVMIYYTDVIGIDSSSSDDPAAKRFRGRVIKFYEYSKNPGFVQIQQKDHDYLMTRASQFDIFTEKSGPAHKTPQIIQMPSENNIRNLDIDAVFSVLCNGWPTAARKWTTRCRPSGWPTEDLVELVVSGGHHLVEKTHPRHTGNDVLWRISLSKAELCLIESWMPEQKNIYYVPRLIKKSVVKACGGSSQTVLCTYHFKTLMLWQCEKQPKSYWMNGNICEIIVTILCELIGWFIDKNCPNYFIPENNMLDHIPADHDFSKEVDFLSDYLDEDRLLPFKNILNKGSVACLNVFDSMMSHFARFLPGIMDNREERPDQLETETKIKQFKDVYMALKLQAELMRSAESKKMPKRTIEDGENAVEATLLRTVLQEHWALWTDPPLETLRSQLDVLLSRNSYAILLENALGGGHSLFICVTYLVNFYYAAKRDYVRARNLCQKIFQCLNINEPFMTDISSFCNIAATEFCFPVLLSSDWLNLFDEDIQTVVGFLRVYGLNASDQNCLSDAIKICPVLYLHYINAQCEMRLKGTERRSLVKSLNDFTMHFKKICPSDRHPWDVSTDQRKLRATILITALRRRLLKCINNALRYLYILLSCWSQ